MSACLVLFLEVVIIAVNISEGLRVVSRKLLTIQALLQIAEHLAVTIVAAFITAL